MSKFEPEVFKDIPGYEGVYKISSHGRVWSCPNSAHNGKFLRPGLGNGYLTVSLHKDKRGKSHYIHRLIAEAFVDGDKTLTVNHIDGDRENNNTDNLEWVTHAQNIQHAYDIGLEKSNVGETVWTAKLNEKKVVQMRDIRRKRGYTYKHLGSMFGVAPNTASLICRRRIWRHV